MIQIPLTPEQFQSKAERVQKQQGIQLAGTAGTIAKMGVKADWSYDAGVLTITVVEKPSFLSEAAVEGQLMKML